MINREPVLEFKYQTINTTGLNVSLTTSETCAGTPTYRSILHGVTEAQKLVNDIMEETGGTCPTNNLIDIAATFGDTFRTTHKNYKLQEQEFKKLEETRRKDAAQRIQRLYKKSRKLLFPLQFDSEFHLKK